EEPLGAAQSAAWHHRRRGHDNGIKLKAMVHLLELAWPAILMCHFILWGLATQDLYRRYLNNLSPTRPRFAQQFDVWPLAAFAFPGTRRISLVLPPSAIVSEPGPHHGAPPLLLGSLQRHIINLVAISTYKPANPNPSAEATHAKPIRGRVKKANPRYATCTATLVNTKET